MGVKQLSGVQISDLKSKLNTEEPRYYLFASGTSKCLCFFFFFDSVVILCCCSFLVMIIMLYFDSLYSPPDLLYVCPESSQISLRMVYSTAKPSVADAAKACGIQLTRVVCFLFLSFHLLSLLPILIPPNLLARSL